MRFLVCSLSSYPLIMAPICVLGSLSIITCRGVPGVLDAPLAVLGCRCGVLPPPPRLGVALATVCPVRDEVHRDGVRGAGAASFRRGVAPMKSLLAPVTGRDVLGRAKFGTEPVRVGVLCSCCRSARSAGSGRAPLTNSGSGRPREGQLLQTMRCRRRMCSYARSEFFTMLYRMCDRIIIFEGRASQSSRILT